jgi:hypothetical protein
MMITGSLLTKLPNELLTSISSALEPGSSLMLGLTCTQLYAIHFSVHGPMTNLFLGMFRLPGPYTRRQLHGMLSCFMGEAYVFCAKRAKFVLREKILDGSSECACLRCNYFREKLGLQVVEESEEREESEESEESDENGY